jgi:ankyrin repeat protein
MYSWRKTTRDDGCTPLHIAAEGGLSRDIVRYLIERGPRALREPSGHGTLPLHTAAASGRSPFATVQLLANAFPEGPSRFEIRTAARPPPMRRCECGAALAAVSFLTLKRPAVAAREGQSGAPSAASVRRSLTTRRWRWHGS